MVVSVNSNRVETLKNKKFNWRKFFVWVITVHSKDHIQVFEFDTEKEAKEALENIQDYKILTEVIYFNDESLVES